MTFSSCGPRLEPCVRECRGAPSAPLGQRRAQLGIISWWQRLTRSAKCMLINEVAQGVCGRWRAKREYQRLWDQSRARSKGSDCKVPLLKSQLSMCGIVMLGHCGTPAERVLDPSFCMAHCLPLLCTWGVPILARSVTETRRTGICNVVLRRFSYCSSWRARCAERRFECPALAAPRPDIWWHGPCTHYLSSPHFQFMLLV